jgi:hypothetical protein
MAWTLASSSCPPHIQPPVAQVPMPMVEMSNPDDPSALRCIRQFYPR